MSPEGTKRKLTAIVSADVKGYSRLMEDDEEATVATLTTYRQVITGVVKKHEGRVVDSPGDNVLAEFTSVVEAMRGAVEIQEELRARNADLPDHRRMEFRIGINLGDVIEEEGRIYGDGVNIAARVESLADAGGICLSESAYQQVKNKLSLGIEFLGQHEVKNISEPVPVYRLVMEPGAVKAPVSPPKKAQPSPWKKWAMPAIPAVIVAIVGVATWQFYLRPQPPSVEPASVERMAFLLPEKPSIAVLPFTNMSGDPEQEYIADGISENIIAALAKIPEMFVIARNSTFSYKGKSPKIQQVAEELGVKHVLEGSVQKSGDRIRVTAQLIDALTGHHLWSEIYDRQMKDLFAVMDEITKEIVVALQVELTEGEQARVRQDTKSLQALGYWVQAQPLWDRVTKEDHAKARALLEKAVAIDPEYVSAWARLGHLHYTAARLAGYGWSDSREESVKRTEELAQKALAMDPSHPEANAVMGHVHLLRREHDEAVAWFRKAVVFGPNDADIHAYLAIALRWTGKPEESIQLFQQAMRLQPAYPWWYLLQLSRSYREAGRYEEAIATVKQLLDPRWGESSNRKKMWVHIVSASCYVFLGRFEEARAQVAEWEKINPKLSMEGVSQYIRTAEYFQDAAYEQRLIESWRKAGVPERPPLPLPDKPSIAVLPFANISGDPEQEYFADGMTDDLITDLSKISGLFVIARNSVFSYKGKSPKVQQVGRDLGVRYVLEGSVRRAADQVRINAQLIDAKTGGHLWAERYDGNTTDIFALQDKINRKIVGALAIQLTPDEERKVARRGTGNIAAYDAFLKGSDHRWRSSPEEWAKAVPYYEKAMKLDSNYGDPQVALAYMYYLAGVIGGKWPGAMVLSRWECLKRSRYLIRKALESDTPAAHGVLAEMYSSWRLYDRAVAEAERALQFAPNDPSALSKVSSVFVFAGRPREAIEYAQKAMRLDPRSTGVVLYEIGLSHFCLGHYDEAAASLERNVRLLPDHYWANLFLASAYAHLGRVSEASAALEKCRSGNRWSWPDNLRLATASKASRLKDLGCSGRYADGLLKAGLPGEPGGYYKFLEENRLTGDKIRDLVTGHTLNFQSLYGKTWQQDFSEEGEFNADPGRWWTEEDLLCVEWEGWYRDLSFCGTVFRNLDGINGIDEYMTQHPRGVHVFSVEDEN